MGRGLRSTGTEHTLPVEPTDGGAIVTELKDRRHAKVESKKPWYKRTITKIGGIVLAAVVLFGGGKALLDRGNTSSRETGTTPSGDVDPDTPAEQKTPTPATEASLPMLDVSSLLQGGALAYAEKYGYPTSIVDTSSFVESRVMDEQAWKELGAFRVQNLNALYSTGAAEYADEAFQYPPGGVLSDYIPGAVAEEYGRGLMYKASGRGLLNQSTVGEQSSWDFNDGTVWDRPVIVYDWMEVDQWSMQRATAGDNLGVINGYEAQTSGYFVFDKATGATLDFHESSIGDSPLE